MNRSSARYLESLLRQLLPVPIAAALAVSLIGCFGDTPEEPSRSAPVAPEFTATAAAVIGTATDLGTLGGSTSEAYGINTNGRIVGRSKTSSGAWHAFSWVPSTMTDLGTLGGSHSEAQDVSDGNLIVGESSTADPEVTERAFLWHDGSMADLDDPNGKAFCRADTHANAVNGNGLIVGYINDSECFLLPALWENGTATPFQGIGVASDINDEGQVVGWAETGGFNVHEHGFLWQHGTSQGQDLGTLGGNRSVANAINESGQVVGSAQIPNGITHAFRWQNGSMIDLGVLGGNFSSAADINDDGLVVGVTTTATGQTHAFWWQNGVMSDLGTLGGDTTRVAAVNNSGQVVGSANQVAGGQVHAVRWTIPTTNFWSGRRALPPARQGMAVGTASSLLYVIGGKNSAGTALATVEAYNPSTNSWTSKRALPAARHHGDGAATISGTIYVAGGQNAANTLTRTLYAYNSGTNIWSTKANMPVVGGCGGSAVIGGKLYVFSGCTRSGSGAQVAAGLLHRYDPGTNTWTTLQSAPAVHSQPVVGVTGGKLYVVGGTNGAGVATNRLDVYDPATNTWSTKAAMPTARTAMAGAMNAGKLYVSGGRNGGATTYFNKLEVYDPVSNSWSARAAMPVEQAEHGVGVINNLLYAIGGRTRTMALAINQRYTP
jgi:probable HAF family extracellular repeat protein